MGASVGALGEVWLQAEGDAAGAPLPTEEIEAMAQEFRRLVRMGRLALCGLGSSGGREEFFSLASEVRAANDRIGDMDVVLLAGALNCPDGQVFYTCDAPILVSTKLTELGRKQGVRIEDPTSSRGMRTR